MKTTIYETIGPFTIQVSTSGGGWMWQVSIFGKLKGRVDLAEGLIEGTQSPNRARSVAREALSNWVTSAFEDVSAYISNSVVVPEKE